MAVTIKDVARYCGVSVSTVSRCLNGYTDIGKNTREKVFEAIKVLDFVPNGSARLITRKNTRIIGLTIPDIKDPFFAENASGAERFLEENGYQLFYGNMERSADKFVRFLHHAREMRFDGLIITPDSWSPELLDELQKIDIPIVSLRRRPPQSLGIPYVDNDHKQGVIDMMNYLTGLGHTDIAHIVLPTEIGDIRKSAYLEYCSIRNLHPVAIDMELPANVLDDAKNTGYRAMELIREKYPEVTAVFAATDQLAIGAMSYLLKNGLKVPEDISVAGINNMDYSDLPWFDLTTMSLNRAEMGKECARMLLGMIDGSQRHPNSLLLDSDLIVRGSTMKL